MHKSRRQSLYAEVLYPRAKKYLRKCSLCGRIGFSPDILENDYEMIKDDKAVGHGVKERRFELELIRKALQKKYEPLALDRLGRCEMCAEASQ